jgi:hypothetical protein
MRHLILLSVTSFVAACAVDPGDGPELTDEDSDAAELQRVHYLDQGWDAATREAFHTTDQGGGLLPYDYLVALEQASSRKRFLDADNLRSFGFLIDQPDAKNPDGLPLGVVKVGTSLSFTCAACHTGEVTFRGKRLRIDGGQGFTDTGEFLVAAAEALERTVAERAKLGRFARRLGRSDTAALLAELQPVVESFGRFARNARGPRRFGFGRADSTNLVINSFDCDAIGTPENCAPAVVPSNIPSLWGTADLEWVQTNANQNVPIIRDLVQAMIFGRPKLQPDGTITHEANIGNIRALEGWVATLQAPAWPADVFGPIDTAKAQRGSELYATLCESCHSRAPFPMSPPNAFGKSFVTVAMTPVAEVGTDPLFVDNFLGRRALPGPLVAAFMPQDIDPAGKVSALALNRILFGLIFRAVLATQTPAERVAFLDQREFKSASDAQLMTYKAGPLRGVALSGYFLHNGSVRTLYQLLLPSAQRETSFFVGSREFDPIDVGYVSDRRARNAYRFVTSNPGDSAAGHEYGTALDDAERYDLIEYLKTL